MCWTARQPHIYIYQTATQALVKQKKLQFFKTVSLTSNLINSSWDYYVTPFLNVGYVNVIISLTLYKDVLIIFNFTYENALDHQKKITTT